MGQVQNLLITLVVVSLVITGINSFYLEGANAYSVDYSDLEYMSNANETLNNIQRVQTQTETATSQGIIGTGIAIIEGGISSLKMLFDSTTLASAMINDFADATGTGDYVLYFMAIITIIVVLGILSSAVRWNV